MYVDSEYSLSFGPANGPNDILGCPLCQRWRLTKDS